MSFQRMREAMDARARDTGVVSEWNTLWFRGWRARMWFEGTEWSPMWRIGE